MNSPSLIVPSIIICVAILAMGWYFGAVGLAKLWIRLGWDDATLLIPFAIFLLLAGMCFLAAMMSVKGMVK
jgi:hypothetical protein